MTFADSEYAKEKRAGVMRLFPFPRVGRSDPDLATGWDNGYNYNNGGNGNRIGSNTNAGYDGSSFEEYDAGNCV